MGQRSRLGDFRYFYRFLVVSECSGTQHDLVWGVAWRYTFHTKYLKVRFPSGLDLKTSVAVVVVKNLGFC